jgi:S-adenosyl-L-methionine hydrolase (adenosine-forming)
MAIVTLTSDMGLKDFYLASVKASILTQCPEVALVDITHQIAPFDIAQASFVLRNIYNDFPSLTIHIVSVDTEADEENPYLLVCHQNQFFISADNGIFSLLFDEQPNEIYAIENYNQFKENTFPAKYIFADVACKLMQGVLPETFGRKINKIRQRVIFRPVVDKNIIRGSIMYIDSYGNLISNVSKHLFDEVCKQRNFTIYFGRGLYDIKQIHENYNQVPEGEKVALFASGGNLEIAINKGVEGSGGGASSLFGMKLNDTFRIEFDEM